MRTQTQMTRLITVAALCAAAVCAQATQKKSDKTATTSAKTPARATVLTVPTDAVKNADGTWNYTDKQGRKWVYVSTPFGIMKTDVTDAENKPVVPPTVATKVIDKGDTVRFEQGGPFGPITWEKKKSDLTDQERQMVEAQQNQSGNQSQPETAKPETR
jgi:hypothetical protein